MRPIHPITEQSCRDHYGKPVLIVLRDGSELVATLSKFDNDKIILNGGEETAGTRGSSSTKSTIRSGRSKNKTKAAKVRAYKEPDVEPGFGPFGGALVLETSSVALLFSLV